MKIGTDFSGIGSPEMALKLIDVKHEVEFACEIDKHARKSYEAIYGKPKKFYEDITKRNHKEVPQLDLYVAGFPCQAFSIAGNRKGFDEARGTLFFNVAEFIKENQPKTFILENVKGLLSHDNGKTFETIISILSDNGGTVNQQQSIPYYDDGLGYHIYYQVLNTKDYGIPQNRERIFIVGFKDFRKFSFPLPFPLKLKLKDLLQDKVDDKYFLSEKSLNGLLKGQSSPQFTDGNDVARCFTAGGNSGGMHSSMTLLQIKSNTSKGYEEAKEGDSINYSIPNSKTRRGRVGKQVAQTLDTACNMGVVLVSKEVRTDEAKKKRRETGSNSFRSKEIEFRDQDFVNTLQTGLTNDHYIKTEKIRRLTPLECWRLQAYPDGAFNKAQEVSSDTQLYKQAGNSISVNVMKLIIENVIKSNQIKSINYGSKRNN